MVLLISSLFSPLKNMNTGNIPLACYNATNTKYLHLLCKRHYVVTSGDNTTESAIFLSP